MRDLVQEYLFRRREDLQGPLWLVESVPVKCHPNFTWGTIVFISERREFMGVREDDGSVVIVVASGGKNYWFARIDNSGNITQRRFFHSEALACAYIANPNNLTMFFLEQEMTYLGELLQKMHDCGMEEYL